MKVEFLLAYDDNTWRTKVIDVPDDEVEFGDSGNDPDDAELVTWANCHLAGTAEYRKVVLFAVYGVPSE